MDKNKNRPSVVGRNNKLEAQLTRILGEEIRKEIDAEILKKITDIASGYII